MDYTQLLLLFAGFAAIGAGIKYVDAAFDDGTVKKGGAYVVAILSGAAMGYFIGTDPFAAMLLLSIILGVAVTGKIDAPPFVMGAIIALAVPALFSSQVTLQTLPVSLLVLAAVLDELGNDFVDAKRVANHLISSFFRYRLTMECFMAGLVLVGLFPWEYLVALVCLDLGYQALTVYSDSKRATTLLTAG